MSRRGNQEGTIRQRAENRWQGSISFDGQRHWVTGTSQAEVRRLLGELRTQHGVGELVRPSKVTLGHHLASWLEDGSADWKPKTVKEYESIIRVYLLPVGGNIPLQRLTPAMVSGWYARWRRERNVSGGTVLNVHRVLHRALTIAVRQGLVSRNVTDALEPPKARRKRPDLWSAEETARFVSMLPGDQWGALWAILLGSGCRLGEAVALRWDDLDRDTGTVAIERSTTWVGRAPVTGQPKTQSGTRSVTLPPFALEVLRRWKPSQTRLQLAQGVDWRGDGRIITMADGALPSPWDSRNALAKSRTALGLPHIRIHDMRHLHASLLIAQGLPLTVVSARLGHGSPAITAAIYSHALRGGDGAAATAIEAAMRVAR